MFELLSILFVAASIFFALATLLLGVKRTFGARWSSGTDRFAVAACSSFALECVELYQHIPLFYLLGALVLINVVIAFARARFSEYTSVGLFFYATNIFLSLVGVPWGLLFVANVPLSGISRLLMLITSPLLFLTLPFGFVQMLESYDVLCRTGWSRPRGVKRASAGYEPMVCLQVPTYAEPPEIVIETLNKIAQLDYDNYEVLVIDNNTKDENLWRPVEAHCRTLGKKFRFFHVDPLAGAKAGALNFAITQMSPKAEIIGVLDADYHPSPNFIADLIGHFEDPAIGFVQTPHDYRDWEKSLYLKMCYWEYKAFFHTILVALNERDAALTIGTMCLLRKSAIQAAGGWATWCVTEDSELAIRIHDAGYSSVYVPITYGKGLIPDRFSDYAKQRYRWIAGPVQELRHHMKHFFGLDGKISSLNWIQRLHHFHHGFGSTMFTLNIPLTLLSIILVLSMALHKEIIPVPFPLWISITTLFFTNFFLLWLQYRTLLSASIKEMMLGYLANKALTFTVNIAALLTTINTNQKWRRTNKFLVTENIRSALASTSTEIAIGSGLITFAAGVYAAMPFQGLLTMCLIGIAFKGIDHLAAPVVAIIAMRSQRQSLSPVKKNVFKLVSQKVRSVLAG